MRKITMMSLALTGCASHMVQMKIDPPKVIGAQATLRIESPDLARRQSKSGDQQAHSAPCCQ